jgi:hypothetical protein
MLAFLYLQFDRYLYFHCSNKEQETFIQIVPLGCDCRSGCFRNFNALARRLLSSHDQNDFARMAA